MSGVAIRPLDRARDAAAVASLFARAADYVWLETGRSPGPETVADFFEDAPPIAPPRPPVHLGAWGPDGDLHGIASMAWGFPDPSDAYIGLLLLDPAQRGQGLGRRMVAHLAAEAAAAGAQRILAAVLAENPRAHAFWRREGFQDLWTAPPARLGDRTHVRIRMARPVQPAKAAG